MHKPRVMSKLGTKMNSCLLSSRALLTPTNCCHKKKIIVPNECIGMKDVAINQGHRQTHELNFNSYFRCYLGLHLRP